MNTRTGFASLALCGAALFAAGCGDSVSPEPKTPGAPQFGGVGWQPPGNLMVTTSTTGSDLDPDGYTVTVDGGPSQHIATDGSVLFPALTAANHSVALSDLASNCSVTGDNPRNVTVPSAATITTIFDVACGAPPSLAFTQQPNDAAPAPACNRVPPLLGETPGSEIVTEVTVQDDPEGTVKEVTLTIASNSGGGTLCSGSTAVTSLTAPVVNHVAHFSFDIDQPLTTLSGIYTLLASTTTPGVGSVVSSSFCVSVPFLGGVISCES